MHVPPFVVLLSLVGLSGCMVSFDREFDFDRDGESSVTDCDDEEASIHHGADEVCEDGIDQDCDEAVDECSATGEGVDERGDEEGNNGNGNDNGKGNGKGRDKDEEEY